MHVTFDPTSSRSLRIIYGLRESMASQYEAELTMSRFVSKIATQ